MLDGDSLNGFVNSFSGCVVARDPQNENRYYLFTNSNGRFQEDKPEKRTLHYTLIDLTLDGGNGGVVPGQKNIWLMDDVSGHMGIMANDCKMYLVGIKNLKAEVYSYEITHEGIKGPILSSYTGAHHNWENQGSFREANCNPFFVVSEFDEPTVKFHFNFTSGKVDSVQQINFPANLSYLDHFGVNTCVSPNDSFLITGVVPGGFFGFYYGLIRYELFHSNVDSIINSAEVIAFSDYNHYGNHYGDLMFYNSNDVIQLMRFGGYTRFILNATSPNPTVMDSVRFFPDTSHQLVYCGQPRNQCHYPAVGQPFKVLKYAKEYHDFLPKDTLICRGDSVLLRDEVLHSTLSWSDGTQAKERWVHQPGTYVASRVGNCLTKYDTITVSFKPQPSLEKEVPLCQAERTEVGFDLVEDGQIALWSDGEMGTSRLFSSPGTYYVTTSYAGCTFQDSIHITEDGCCDVFLPNAYSPNGDGLNDEFLPVFTCEPEFALARVYDRWGKEIARQRYPFSGSLIPKAANSTLYVVDIQYKFPKGEVVNLQKRVHLIR